MHGGVNILTQML